MADNKPAVYNLPIPPDNPEEIPQYLQDLISELEQHFSQLDKKVLDNISNP